MTEARIAITTVGSEEEAGRIAQALVEERLAACVQILPAIQSIYRWKGAIQNEREWLLVIKTMSARIAEVERRVGQLHSYEVPEFVVLEVAAVGEPYLAWLAGETTLLC